MVCCSVVSHSELCVAKWVLDCVNSPACMKVDVRVVRRIRMRSKLLSSTSYAMDVFSSTLVADLGQSVMSRVMQSSIFRLTSTIASQFFYRDKAMSMRQVEAAIQQQQPTVYYISASQEVKVECGQAYTTNKSYLMNLCSSIHFLSIAWIACACLCLERGPYVALGVTVS